MQTLTHTGWISVSCSDEHKERGTGGCGHLAFGAGSCSCCAGVVTSPQHCCPSASTHVGYRQWSYVRVPPAAADVLLLYASCLKQQLWLCSAGYGARGLGCCACLLASAPWVCLGCQEARRSAPAAAATRTAEASCETRAGHRSAEGGE